MPTMFNSFCLHYHPRRGTAYAAILVLLLPVVWPALVSPLGHASPSVFSQVRVSKMAQIQISKASSLPSGSLLGEVDSPNPPSNSVSASETGHTISNDSDYCDVDASKHGTLHGFDLASLGGTQRLTPPGSPPRIATGLAQKSFSLPISPRRDSISVAAARNLIDDRPGTQLPSMASSFEAGAQSGRTKVDGKEFFRQVRSRLSYEQFSTFLSNVKELNSHNQTRGETLRKVDEIFGSNNKDLYNIFEGLITRSFH